jgi:hypothetical protein
MEYKYKKHESPEWYWQIDLETLEKISFTNGSPRGKALFDAMKQWEAEGNTIEEAETEEEAQEKATAENLQALQDMKEECKKLLAETDHKVSRHTKYPDDIPAWEAYRVLLWDLLDGDEVKELPEKPF